MIDIPKHTTYFKYYAYLGEELHIVRNSTARVLSLSDIFSTSTTRTVSYHIHGLAPSNQYTYESIVLNSTTGEIYALPYNSSSGHVKLFSVIVKVSITDTGTPTTSHEDLFVVVNIHDGINNIWFPIKPIIYSHNMGYRPCLFAEFYDTDAQGANTTTVICDISHLPGFSWILSAAALNTLAYSTAYVYSGFIFVKSGTTITNSTLPNGVTVTAPAYLNGGTISSDIDLVALTDQLSPVGNTSTRAIADVNNIIIFSEGYTANEQADFNLHASTIVNQFQTQTSAAPYSYATNDLNFWSYFVPSADIDSGCSLSGPYIEIASVPNVTSKKYLVSRKVFIEIIDAIIIELKSQNGNINSAQSIINNSILGLTLTNNINWTLAPTPITGNPVLASSIKSMSELVDIIGFPSKQDLNKQLTTNKYPEWGNFLTNITAPNVTNNIINEFTYSLWLKMANLVYFEPRNTLWKVANMKIGPISNLKPSQYQESQLHIPPGTYKVKTNLNRFISKLKDKISGVNVGATLFDSTSGSLQGIKGNYIVFLSKVLTENIFGNHIKHNHGNYLVTSVADVKPKTVIGVLQSNGAYKPEYLAKTGLTPSEVGVALHEFSHNFVLDEYSGNQPFPQTDDTDISNLESFKHASNSGTVLHGDAIKWNWPRITAAGMSTGALTPHSGNIYTINVGRLSSSIPNKPDYTQLAIGNMVILRVKDLFTVAGHEYPVFEIKDIQNPQYKLEYKGFSATFLGDTRTTIPATFSASNNIYTNETLIVRPVWAPNSNSRFLGLVHHELINWMNSTNPTAPTGAQRALVEIDTSASNSLQTPQAAAVTHLNSLGLRIPQPSSLITGLYAGAAGFNENIYHATGFCTMRSSVNGANVNNFCIVCQYIIADSIAPWIHPNVDAAYSNVYL